MKYEIDRIDKQILKRLTRDSRTPFLEIARELDVSGGTIHARVRRMKDAGVICGSQIVLDYGPLGYQISAFVGITLSRAGSFQQVVGKLEQVPEVVEIHYTTGSYALFVRIEVRTIQDLYVLIAERLQHIDQIQSTETFVILNTPIRRSVAIDSV